MGNEKIQYTDWLQRNFNFSVRDFEQTKVPWFWRNFSHAAGMTIKGRIVYVRDIEGWHQQGLSWLLDHEVDHIQQQRKDGWTQFLFRYALIPKYRMKKEVEAYTRSMERHFLLGRDIDKYPKKYAESLRDDYFLKSQWVTAWEKLARNCYLIKTGEIHVVADRIEKWKRETGR